MFGCSMFNIFEKMVRKKLGDKREKAVGDCRK
jgi:hypothetical protein